MSCDVPRPSGHLTRVGSTLFRGAQQTSQQAGTLAVPHAVNLVRTEMTLEGGNHFFLRRTRIVTVARQGIGGQAAFVQRWPHTDPVLRQSLPRKQLARIVLACRGDI